MTDAVVAEDSFEAKHKRAMRRTEMMEAQARSQLRLIGPQCIQEESFAVRKCPKCNPPPEVFTCPMCDWYTTEKWRFKLHLDINPKWCRDRGARKARLWARQV